MNPQDNTTTTPTSDDAKQQTPAKTAEQIRLDAEVAAKAEADKANTTVAK